MNIRYYVGMEYVFGKDVFLDKVVLLDLRVWVLGGGYEMGG